MARTVAEILKLAALPGGYQPAAEEYGALKEHVRRHAPDDPTTADIERLFPQAHAEAVDETTEHWLTSHSGWSRYRADRQAERDAAPDPGQEAERQPEPEWPDVRRRSEGMTLGRMLEIMAGVQQERRRTRIRAALGLLFWLVVLLAVYGLLDLLDVIPDVCVA